MCGQATPGRPQHFIGGSDARIIMGSDEAALHRLWREKRGEAEPEDLSGNLIVQLGLRYRRPQSSLVRAKHRAGGDRRPEAGPAPFGPSTWRPPSTAGSKKPEPSLRPSLCCPGASPRRVPPKSICRSYSTTCGSPMPRLRCSQSSPAAANGWKSPSWPIRFTNTCCSRRKRSSGGVLRPVTRRACSASNRPGPGSKPCASST